MMVRIDTDEEGWENPSSTSLLRNILSRGKRCTLTVEIIVSFYELDSTLLT
jgi:hypothetical protein